MFIVPTGSLASTYVLTFPVSLDTAVAILGAAVAGACALLWAAMASRAGRMPPPPPRRRQPSRRVSAPVEVAGLRAA